MPKQAVVFIKRKSRRHNKLYIRLILPGEQEVEYSVNAVRALGYTPQELAENEMKQLTADFQAGNLEFIKNPVIAEFLGLSSSVNFTEIELESSILSNIQNKHFF